MLNELVFSSHNEIKVWSRHFYAMGINVVPAYAMSKTAFGAWGYAKVTGRVPSKALGVLFAVPCNLALITGKTSANLFGFECDSQATFQEIITRTVAAGLPVFAQWTGGGRGGGHVFFKCADGVVTNLREGQLLHLPDLGVRSEGNYLIGPGSRLPTGVYRLYEGNTTQEIPTASLAELQQILPELTLARTPRRRKAKARQTLHPGTRQYLDGKPGSDEYHIHLYAAASDPARSGRFSRAPPRSICPVDGSPSPVYAEGIMRKIDLDRLIHIRLIRLETEHYDEIRTLTDKLLWDSRIHPEEYVEKAFRRFLAEGYRAARQRFRVIDGLFEMFFGDE